MYQFSYQELLSMLNEYAEVHGYSFIHTINNTPDGRALEVSFYGSDKYLSKDVTIYYDKNTTLAQLWLII